MINIKRVDRVDSTKQIEKQLSKESLKILENKALSPPNFSNLVIKSENNLKFDNLISSPPAEMFKRSRVSNNSSQTIDPNDLKVSENLKQSENLVECEFEEKSKAIESDEIKKLAKTIKKLKESFRNSEISNKTYERRNEIERSIEVSEKASNDSYWAKRYNDRNSSDEQKTKRLDKLGGHNTHFDNNLINKIIDKPSRTAFGIATYRGSKDSSFANDSNNFNDTFERETNQENVNFKGLNSSRNKYESLATAGIVDRDKICLKKLNLEGLNAKNPHGYSFTTENNENKNESELCKDNCSKDKLQIDRPLSSIINIDKINLQKQLECDSENCKSNRNSNSFINKVKTK